MWRRRGKKSRREEDPEIHLQDKNHKMVALISPTGAATGATGGRNKSCATNMCSLFVTLWNPPATP